jgi:Flp pilus assembly pilin Flp
VNKKHVRRTLWVEEGQAMIEYALILAFVALVCVGTLTLFAGPLNGIFSAVAGGF